MQSLLVEELDEFLTRLELTEPFGIMAHSWGILPTLKYWQKQRDCRHEASVVSSGLGLRNVAPLVSIVLFSSMPFSSKRFAECATLLFNERFSADTRNAAISLPENATTVDSTGEMQLEAIEPYYCSVPIPASLKPTY